MVTPVNQIDLEGVAMSPLFGSKGREEAEQSDQLPLVSDLGPQIEAEANRLEAMLLAELAAEIVRTAFSADYQPDQGMLEVPAIVDAFLPPHGDWTGSPWKAPAAPEGLLRLRDTIREGLQILEHAGLLMPKGYNIQGDFFQYGYVTTRRGRAALTDGSLERILSAAAPA
jgi:hypothetical protein